MSHHLSDASRFLRGLAQLSRQIVNEAARSGDPHRRPPSTLETLVQLVSNSFILPNRIDISSAISKTTWKSSVLIRQTGIAVANAIRSSPSSEACITRPIDKRISICSHRETDSFTAAPMTICNRDEVPVSTRSKMDLPAGTTTNSLVQDKIPIPMNLKLDSTNARESAFIQQKSELIMPRNTSASTSYLSITRSRELSASTVEGNASKVESTIVPPSTVDELSAPLTLEENKNLFLPPPTSHEAQARAVPTTRIGRLASFGSLAAGLGVGALSTMVRRSVGLEQSSSSQTSISPYLSKANAERIVDTLCKVRGAALKLGQMISIQDNFLVEDDMQNIFERVRQKADFMPEWQMNEVMTNEFGVDWRNQFHEFQDRPFAAASIGQVHYGILKDKKKCVAIKIQYPGVGKSIESDINNLMTLLNFWNIIPRGLYIDSVIKVAKRELSWEVDYLREAEWGRRFQNWLRNYPIFLVPDIIDDLSTKNVLTTTYFDGITLDRALDEDQVTRDQIGKAILEVCLLEIFKFKAMQTDPNWSNFLFNSSNKTIGLIDFGSSRYFSPQFIDYYIRIIRASADNDPERVKELSVQSGFLTGYETREMTDAHVNAVMILGEAFRIDKAFDFGSQSTTRNIHRLIPIMLKHRLTPPPEDSYSLHRKMSGAFLLCTKLRSKVYCKPLFERIWEEYNSS